VQRRAHDRVDGLALEGLELVGRVAHREPAVGAVRDPAVRLARHGIEIHEDDRALLGEGGLHRGGAYVPAHRDEDRGRIRALAFVAESIRVSRTQAPQVEISRQACLGRTPKGRAGMPAVLSSSPRSAAASRSERSRSLSDPIMTERKRTDLPTIQGQIADRLGDRERREDVPPVPPPAKTTDPADWPTGWRESDPLMRRLLPAVR
jgi:hypothetical protein